MVVTTREIKEIEAGIATDYIGFDQFNEIVKKYTKPRREQDAELKAAFKVFDKDGTGNLDIDRLKHIVTTLGDRFSPEEFDEIWKTIELPESGTLQYQNLIDMAPQY